MNINRIINIFKATFGAILVLLLTIASINANKIYSEVIHKNVSKNTEQNAERSEVSIWDELDCSQFSTNCEQPEDRIQLRKGKEDISADTSISSIMIGSIMDYTPSQSVIFFMLFLNSFFCFMFVEYKIDIAEISIFIDIAPILGVIGTLIGLSTAVLGKFSGDGGGIDTIFSSFSTATSTTIYGGFVYITNYVYYFLLKRKIQSQ